ncbi:HNH endonuclease [Paenibacillus sp. PR3]|uniref:HNH endonuclease n=1 Tax=Paenibacillus terricola TaxID=2763503 RepID=A0ABR8MXC5_9BACL|nr:HNH endonuclease signature motif containing protein [Paenibacillus terricola]MBD3920215.1 HNH endonuclease [Paenibacillus terricola]
MSNIQCAGCGAEKPPEAYPKRSGRQTRRGVCRACLRSRKRLRALGNEHAEPPAAQTLYGEQAAASESGAQAADAAGAASVTADTAGEQPKRKRKRNRRRGKRAKKKAALEARIDEAADTQLTSVAETTVDTEHEKDLAESINADRNDHEIAAYEGSNEDAAVSEQESGDKRKRKRKRRRRSKKKGTISVSSISDEEDHTAELQSSNEDSSELLSSANPSADSEGRSAEYNEEEAPAKRKRKRKRRRRKGKQNAEGEAPIPEVEAPKRPAIRPPNKRIVPFKGPFTFDATILNDKGTGMIRLRGRRETGKRWHTEIDKEIAVRMVQEGAAGIIHPRLIHKLYTKSDFRLLILQRDNYVCRYCGQFGDTIDHVMPKSKGGLSSPMNCVCACSDCNLLKADKLDFPYPDDLDELDE